MVRVDGNAKIGFGHVMRCLALGQGWVDAGGEILFAVAAENAKAGERLRAAGFPVALIDAPAASMEDSEKTKALARDWVVVDGYDFRNEFTANIRKSGARVLVVDDDGNSSWKAADLILNQNLHAAEAMYARTKARDFCLGPQFALLRKEFVRADRNIPEQARKVLLTLGGGDQSEVASRILTAFRGEEWLAYEIVVLSQGTVEGGPNIRVLESSDRMPDLMAWADVAISGSGSTVWELCFIGTPFVTVVLAPNQEEIAAALQTRGVAEIAGKITALDPARIANRAMALLKDFEKRRRISEAQRQLVDGRGASRVVAKMLAHPAPGSSH
jgi:UDP-2,4-diacetamido-2,4,6-trideoxy-beta-L-altropyranose hydrolase